jgi:hypothetical protein
MIVIFSMILMTEYATLLKQSSQFYQNQWIYFSTRRFLADTAKELKLNRPFCNVSLPPSQSSQFHSKKWWQNHACYQQTGHLSYYYVITALGQDTCAVVDKRNLEFVADYYRLTVYAFDDLNEYAGLLLEQVYAIAIPRIHDCHSEAHAVHIGLQSERLL